MRKITSISTMILCFAVLASGCSKNIQSTKCQYSSVTSGNFGNVVDCTSSDIVNLVNQNYVTVENQSMVVGDYDIALTDFFYNGDTGLVVYKLVISTTDKSKLTEEQQTQFKKLLDNGEIEFSITSIGNKTYSQNLKQDSEGNTILISSLLLSKINDKDKVNHISEKNIKQMTVTYNNKKVSSFLLPGYTLDTEEIWMDTSEDEKVISIQVSEHGMSIIWNTKSIIREFKENLKEIKKEKGKDFNEEDYGYTVFEDLSLELKDGTVYQLCSGGNKFNILYDYIEEYETNQLYNYNVIFNSKIDIQIISCVTIDGVNYYVK